jgi:uroporphyrin-III C-methyltransferase/precorrin-2 dehydrogenase/sirohydrochlorin ferrochelatase
MDNFPIFLRLRGEKVLLIGGGSVAERKLRLLLKAGAHVEVVAAELNAAVTQMLPDAGWHIAKQYETELLNTPYRIVIAATDDSELNQRVAHDAGQRNIPVNVVDDPQHCSFIFPSILDRSPLLLAVSSGGEAPVLARQTRARLETFVPAAWGDLAQLTSRYRETVKSRLPEKLRRRFWEEVCEGPIGEQMLAGRKSEAEQALLDLLNAYSQDQKYQKGEVWLVGAGPGDPDLLTFRALRLMQNCDVVLYDRLVAPAVMELVRRDADRIYVGKKEAEHVVPQDEINQMLIDLAKQGKRVLRLKGGDPFIFGRGGEEIDRLAENDIPFQVVPGITSASGCSSYAGIPLTHRDYAQSCQFVTGHMKDDVLDLEWQELARPAHTVVFYMGLNSLPEIAKQLMAHGAPETRPVALVERGTTSQQRVVTGTLANIAATVKEQGVKSPALIIVGDVVELRERLAWFAS